MTSIGIDPGKEGAIVAIHDRGIDTHAMPLIKREYDLQRLRDIILMYEPKGFDTHIVIEDVHAIYKASAAASFDFGVGVGLIRMAVVMTQIPFTLVNPKVWQKEMFQGVPTLEKAKKEVGRGNLDTKAMALIAAQRIYPKMTFYKSEKAYTPHSGIVDALLMAHYCKLKFSR